MKRIFALLLVLAMLFSLSACGVVDTLSDKIVDELLNGEDEVPKKAEDTEETDLSATPNDGEYDAEFVLFVYGSEEWTPFPGKSCVTFESSREGVITMEAGASTVEFTGKAPGKTTITATCAEETAHAYVRVKRMVAKEDEEDGETSGEVINYHYEPPKDHYYIVYDVISSNGDTTEGVTARIGEQFLVSDDTSYGFWFADFGNMTAHNRLPDGPWVEDTHSGLTENDRDAYDKDPFLLCAMEDYFMDKFYVTIKDMDRLNEYYVGKETLYPSPYDGTGIECWVFDSQGFNAMKLKFWIDPSNGCCLKCENYDIGRTSVVTRYDLNYTAWDTAPCQ